jgi:tetratricopeptide (TPR) repeat protein
MRRLLHRFSLLAVCLGSGCAHPRPQGLGEPIFELSVPQLLDVAELLAHSGDTMRAEQYLSAALQKGADERRVTRRLLALYVADGQYRLAIALAEDCARRHPRDASLHRLLASLYLAVELDASATDEYERVLTLQPDDAQAHFALASLLHGAGSELGRADAHFRAYLRVEPNGPHAEEARARLLTELP